MLTCALAICGKDLRLILARGAGLLQALLLGLLLVFLFSLSLNAGDRLSPQAAAAMFWLASAFCQVLIFNMLYAVEESAQARLGLVLLPAPVQAVWLGKAMAGFLLLSAAQCVFIPAVFVFLGQHLGQGWHFLQVCALGSALCCKIRQGRKLGFGILHCFGLLRVVEQDKGCAENDHCSYEAKNSLVHGKLSFVSRKTRDTGEKKQGRKKAGTEGTKKGAFFWQGEAKPLLCTLRHTGRATVTKPCK